MKVGQMIERARGPNRGKIGGIQAEEEYARLPIVGYVRSDIEFRKARQSGQRRHGASANSTHVEGNDSDPTSAIERVEHELCWDNWPQGSRRQRPVGKEQIVPDLLHHPAPSRHRPRAVCDGLEQAMHATSL